MKILPIYESLVNVDDDVNMIYDEFFKNDIDEIERTGIITKSMFKSSATDTSFLTSQESIKADKLNRCTILINKGINYYDPNKLNISISIHLSAVNYVIDDYQGNLRNAVQSTRNGHILELQFSEEKMKGSIHHELTHWIDDTMHNGHVKKRIKKAMELGTPNINGVPVNSTKMEINAQIHNIKQLHNKYHKFWDNLEFYDMITKSPVLHTVYNQLNSKFKKQWIRDLKTRMSREGLLGKKMINT